MSTTSKSVSEYGEATISHLDIEVGTRVPPLHRVASRLQVTAYCASIRFLHQVHFDDELCRQQGWNGIILPGFLMGNWCIEAATRMLGPRSVVHRASFRMTSVAYPDSPVIVAGTVSEVVRTARKVVVTCALTVSDQEGQVVTRGEVTVSTDIGDGA